MAEASENTALYTSIWINLEHFADRSEGKKFQANSGQIQDPSINIKTPKKILDLDLDLEFFLINVVRARTFFKQ